MAATVHLSLDEAHDLALRALLARGFSDPQGRAVADPMIAAEREFTPAPPPGVGPWRVNPHIARDRRRLSV